MGAVIGTMVLPTLFGWLGWNAVKPGGAALRFAMGALDPITVGAGLILIWYGVIGLTTLDPKLSLTEQPVALRRIARIFAIVTLPLGATYYCLQHVSNLASAGKSVWVDGSQWAFLLTLAYSLMLASYYLARLMERIPDARLAHRTRRAGRTLGILASTTVIARVMVTVTAGWGSTGTLSLSALPKITLIVYALLAGAMGVCALAVLVLWLEFQKKLYECIETANQSRIDPLWSAKN